MASSLSSNYYICNRLLSLSYLRQGIRLVHLVVLFACFVTFFLYLIVFFNWKVVSVWSSERFNITRVQQKVGLSIDTKVDRSKCCVSPGSSKDICGQSNCTFPSCPAAASPQTLNQQLKPDSRHNAFFLETSGKGKFLTIRQACAVESLAFHNPNLTVNVLFMMDNATHYSSSNAAGISNQRSKLLPAETNLDKLKEKYNNIEFITLNLDDYVAGTLLEKWYHCNDWRKGQYHVAHLSDGLRLLTLHKFGGYYFDLDIIFVRRVTYYHNFVSAEASNSFCNNAIHVDYKHPVIQLAVRDFPLHYRKEAWTHNGPDLLMRVMKTFCGEENLSKMYYVTCRGFNVLPMLTFNSLHYSRWKDLFRQRPTNETRAPSWITKEIVGVHIWNKLSYNETAYKNSTQEYVRLVRDNCPVIFSIAPETF